MLLIESLRFENGKFDNLEFHQQRMQNARSALFGISDHFDLVQYLTKTAREKNLPNTGLFKCRIIFAKQVEKTEFATYKLPQIMSLKLVHDDNIDYRYKYLNRGELEKLYNQKGSCDDIIIVKNGLITDSYFANLVFFNGKDWLTPAKPLLKGTRRAQLLDQEKIKTADIRVNDLKHFSKVRLINAMIRLEDEVEIMISCIEV